jgi:hypothetical protein
MRADIHDGPEQKRSNQRPDTLMQDRNQTARRRLLQRTAGPYNGSFATGSSRQQVQPCPLCPKATNNRLMTACREGPKADICFGLE